MSATRALHAVPPLPAENEGEVAPVIPMPPRRPRVRPATAQLEAAQVIELPRPAATAEELTMVRIMAGRICQAALEVLAGTRPVSQLARWLDQRSFEALLVRTQLTRAAQKTVPDSNLRTLHRNAMVRSVHCCPVAAGVYEASLVVAEQHRVRAIALRLEKRHELWKVTALEIG